MIISASYKTDIPAFYGSWFRRRLETGYCKVVNPYNRHQVSIVDLTPAAVDGFVFWTRNPGPFEMTLIDLAEEHRPFMVQYTVTGYPRALEERVLDTDIAVERFRRLASKLGPRRFVWRYDPILLTDHTPISWHLKTFRRLAMGLEGATDEVVVSWAQVYRKTRRNLEAKAGQGGFQWWDPDDGVKRDLLARLVEMAGQHGMTLSLCAQPGLRVDGAREAHCIDAERLAEIAGKPVKAREKGTRPTCRCAESKDIGSYDTCPHGCVYCYAVGSRTKAVNRHKAHDPNGAFLFPP